MNTPIRDGSTRGMIAAAITAVLAFGANKSDWLTGEDIALLSPAVMFAAFFLGGVYDAYIRPKLRQ